MIHCLAEYIFLKTYCHGLCVPLWIHGRTVHCVVVPDLNVCLNAALLFLIRVGPHDFNPFYQKE